MSAALTVGSWHLLAVPLEWEILPGHGVRHVRANTFASVLLMTEEALPEDVTLSQYINRQMEAAQVLLQEVKLRGPVAATILGASEAQRIGISHRSKDGHAVIQIQIYATDGQQAGNVTFTTIEEELRNVNDALHFMLQNLRFMGPLSPPTA